MRRLSLGLLALTLAASAAAQELPKQARDLHEYDLLDVTWSVNVDPAKGAIQGLVVNTVKATKDSPLLVFDCAKLTVTKVLVNGKSTPFRADGAVLAVTANAKTGDTLKVSITYHGLPEAGMYFVPANRTFPAKTPIVYTQGEMEDNRYWLPTYDSPNDKATSHGTVTVPAGWRVLSNGKLIGADGNTWGWTMDQPHSTYLISFVAGPYSEIPDGSDPVPVSIWTPTGLESWGKNAFGGTDAIIRFYGSLTGQPFPWPKYSQSAVADFMFGGMENVTCTTQTITALFPDSARGTRDSTGLDAHELAHQWFGDFVTTPSWTDIWINEGWASFLPTFWAREKNGADEYAIERYDTLESAKGAMRGNPNRSMVWSGWKVPMDAFDGYAYPGGAARMFALMNKVGEPKFWAATKEYLATHAYQNVDTTEFFKSYSKSLNTDLSTFETQWFRTPSVPPTIDVHTAGGKITLHQSQDKLFTLDAAVWTLGKNDQWVKRFYTFSDRDFTISDLPEGPVLVDAEAFLPIDVNYPDAKKEDLLRIWRNAPNVAVKLRLLGRLSGMLTPPERDALMKDEKSARLRPRLVDGVFDPNYLLTLSSDSDERVAQAALGRMGRIPENGVITAKLKNVWTDRNANPDIRLTALQSLYGLSKDPAYLEDAWQTDRFDDGFRTWALDNWAATQPDRAREVALASLTNGATEAVRLTSIRVLGRVKDKAGERTVFNALAAMMTERSNSPLRAAIGALADYGDKAAIPILEKRKDHGLHFVRGDVERAINRLK